MPSRLAYPLAVACSLGLISATLADEAPPKVNFKDNVSSIFQTHCNACHNLDKKKGGLVLDNFSALMQGGGSGSVVEPGDPDNSRLFLVVNHDEEPSMPPNSPKIPDKDIATLRQWIEAGAPETSGSVVVMKEKPKLDFKLDPASIGKPQGEPAMPQSVSTEPAVVTDRPNAILSIASSPWAPLVAIAQHRQAILYNTKTQRLVGVFPFPEGTIASLKFSRDGEILMIGGGRGGQLGRAIGYNVKTGERLFEVGQEYDTVLSADLSPDRSLVALGGPSKTLRVYSTADNSLVFESKKHTEWVTAVAFSPDGVLLASGDRNGGLVVWEAQTGREFYDLRGHQAMITDVSWRLDSNVLASSSEDASVKLWEMQNGNPLKSWNAHGGGTQSVRFAKDGRLVSTGRDRTAKLWDQNGKQLLQFEAFPDLALQADFTLEDQAVVAGDFSGEVRLYDVKDGKRLANLRANPQPIAVRLDAARKALADASAKAQAAKAELDALQKQVTTQTEALAKAEAALKDATAAQATADAELKKAQDLAQAHAETYAAAAKAHSAADFERSRAYTLRQQALQTLYTRDEAARNAVALAASTHSARDEMLAAEAEAALAEATRVLQDNLPAWNAAIEAELAARVTYEKANDERISRDTPLRLLQFRATQARNRVPPIQQAVTAAQTARAAAEKALGEKSPAAQALIDQAATLQAEVDALAAEQARVQAAQAASAKADNG